MRRCAHCGEPLGAQRRSDAKYCDTACRTEASRVRRGVAAPEACGAPLQWAVGFPWAIIALSTGVLASLATAA